MRILAATVVLALLPFPSAAEKRHKPPDLEIIEAAARRTEDKISVEGRVRNSGEKPIKELTLLFNFLAPGKESIATEKGAIDEIVLAPGAEASFHMEANAPPRAVQFQVDAQDGSGRELRVAKAGPFNIE